MTDTEQKALALVQEVQGFDCGVSIYHVHNAKLLRQALCRAIEQHEAFRQEVSAMLIDEYGEEFCRDHSRFARFIIAKPDPLVDAWMDAFPGNHIDDAREECAKINAAIEKRGGRIIFDGSGA